MGATIDDDALDEPRYGFGEEIANCVTHGAGAFLAIAGLVLLASRCATHGSLRQLVGCTVFGVSLVALYLTSTLYHAVPHPPARRLLRLLDHSAIFLLIAGTYTPFTLVTLSGPWGWSLFGFVWGLAAVGITLRVVLRRRPKALFLALYLLMGWCVVVALEPLRAALTPAALGLLVAGGLAYTLGVPFYVWRRPFHHAVWHAFVLAGSACHFFAVLLSVAA